eukprot:gb/GEZN01010498.1/.p1 GENE.gb/GEZN01010498.1/~~gb/GEZN01010498.1/.p1  ORF type:complete len:390 (+),score=39.95 gb/GEZN01010498.1/:35-1204(+)
MEEGSPASVKGDAGGSDFSPRPRRSSSLVVQGTTPVDPLLENSDHVPVMDTKQAPIPSDDNARVNRRSSLGLTPKEFGIPLQLCLECDNEVEGKVCMFCGNDQMRIVSSKEVPEKMKHHWPLVIDGFMHKLGGKKSTAQDKGAWQLRYFALDVKGNLTYHKTDQLHIQQLDEELGRLQVKGAELTSFDLQFHSDRDGYVWGIRPVGAQREYLIEAADYLYRKRWIQELVRLGAVLGKHYPAKRCHGHAIVEQFMFKEGSIFKTWTRRWFTLMKDPPVITYCKEKDVNSKLLGTIELSPQTTIMEGDLTGFEILLKCNPEAKRTYVIRAVDERQRQQWMLAINAVVSYLKGDKDVFSNKNFMPIMTPITRGEGNFQFPDSSSKGPIVKAT